MVADPLGFDGGEAVEFKDALRRALIDDLKEIKDVFIDLDKFIK